MLGKYSFLFAGLFATLAIVSAGRHQMGGHRNRCSSLMCSADYTPVCGSDGEIYSNYCQLLKARCNTPSLRRIRTGECMTIIRNERCSQIMCTAVHQPVCGSDGKTYSNQCALERAACFDPKLRQVSDGQCPDIIATTEPLKSTENTCDTPCFLVYAPVCGSDGITYSNICFLNNRTCRDPTVVHAGDGPCLRALS